MPRRGDPTGSGGTPRTPADVTPRPASPGLATPRPVMPRGVTWGGKKGSSKHAPGACAWNAWWAERLPLFLFARGPAAVTASPGSRVSTLRATSRVELDEILDDPATSSDERGEAALALARVGGVPALDRLVSMAAPGEEVRGVALKDRVREMASVAMALAQFPDARSRAALERMVFDVRFPSEVRSIASAAYGVAGGRPADIVPARSMSGSDRMLAARLGFWREDDFAAAILGFGASGCLMTSDRLLGESARAKSPYLLSHYVTSLGVSGDLAATDRLIELLDHENRFVMETATTALGGLLSGEGRLTGVPAERRSLDAKDLARSREAASKALARQMRAPKVPLSARCLAAISLGRIGGRDNTKALRFALAEEHGQLRSAAALALGLAGAREAQEDLVRFLADTSETDRVRGAGIIGLALMGDVTTSARKRLHGYLGRSAPGVLRGYACQALGKIGDATVVDRMAAIAKSDPELDERLDASLGLSLIGNDAAFEAQRAILEAIREPVVRAAFVRTLGPHPSERPIELLLEVARTDASEKVRASALHALGHVVDESARPLHASMLCDRLDRLEGRPFELIRELL